MDDFGLLAKDLGLRPQGKSAPMSAPRSTAAVAAAANPSRSSRPAWSSADYADVFGGPPKPRPASPSSSPFDSIFHGFNDSSSSSGAAKASSMPVYDKPVYDDDIFDGVPGVRSTGADVFDNVFAPPSGSNRASSPPIAVDDLLESLGRSPRMEADGPSGKRSGGGSGGSDELIPGFGGGSPSQRSEPSKTNHNQSYNPSAKSNASVPEDPFVVFENASTSTYSSSGLFTDPLEQISTPMNSRSTKINASAASEGVFDDAYAFDRRTKSVPLTNTSEKNDKRNERSPLRNVQNMSPRRSDRKEPQQKSAIDPFEDLKPKVEISDDYLETDDILPEKPSKVSNSSTSFSRGNVQNSDTNMKVNERHVASGMSPRSDEADDVWLTVSEIPLFTQPTPAPPPSRPPPPLVIKQAPSQKLDHVASGPERNYSESFWQSSQSNHFSEQASDSVRISGVSPIDELENFAMGKPQPYGNEHAHIFSNEEEETNSAAAASAAAMKEAMDRAEAKFRQAREVRERERDAKSAKFRESAQQEGDEQEIPDVQDWEDRERQERLDRERRQREEKEKEEKRREREREQELERERVIARQAVERATREARERAAAEARLRAERAAVERVNAEARQRAERAAVQKAAAEARERAATEARERAERAAAEARERAAAEARERAAAEAREKAAAEARERSAVEKVAAEARLRAERAAVERAAAEARERASAQARERAAAVAAAAREKQYKNENDLESFFGMGARANSAPRQRASSPETVFDARNKTADAMKRAPAGSQSTFRKASSTTNIVDDLSSIFGATPSSGEFQEVEGETEERRRARLERHQRTLERAAKALAEKNERDIQAQKEQAERHRISETMDIEIKRWAAGKEGNLRALLSTLQYVLWPECGWQPVSLTDLITSASVKKVYRKATLCIHPDKVQQKGANLQQKYIAEKVFDLLKEAWNKFNSEELF